MTITPGAISRPKFRRPSLSGRKSKWAPAALVGQSIRSRPRIYIGPRSQLGSLNLVAILCVPFPPQMAKALLGREGFLFVPLRRVFARQSKWGRRMLHIEKKRGFVKAPRNLIPVFYWGRK